MYTSDRECARTFLQTPDSSLRVASTVVVAAMCLPKSPGPSAAVITACKVVNDGAGQLINNVACDGVLISGDRVCVYTPPQLAPVCDVSEFASEESVRCELEPVVFGTLPGTFVAAADTQSNIWDFVSGSRQVSATDNWMPDSELRIQTSYAADDSIHSCTDSPVDFRTARRPRLRCFRSYLPCRRPRQRSNLGDRRVRRCVPRHRCAPGLLRVRRRHRCRCYRGIEICGGRVSRRDVRAGFTLHN